MYFGHFLTKSKNIKPSYNFFLKYMIFYFIKKKKIFLVKKNKQTNKDQKNGYKIFPKQPYALQNFAKFLYRAIWGKFDCKSVQSVLTCGFTGCCRLPAWSIVSMWPLILRLQWLQFWLYCSVRLSSQGVCLPARPSGLNWLASWL